MKGAGRVQDGSEGGSTYQYIALLLIIYSIKKKAKIVAVVAVVIYSILPADVDKRSGHLCYWSLQTNKQTILCYTIYADHAFTLN